MCTLPDPAGPITSWAYFTISVDDNLTTKLEPLIDSTQGRGFDLRKCPTFNSDLKVKLRGSLSLKMKLENVMGRGNGGEIMEMETRMFCQRGQLSP